MEIFFFLLMLRILLIGAAWCSWMFAFDYTSGLDQSIWDMTTAGEGSSDDCFDVCRRELELVAAYKTLVSTGIGIPYACVNKYRYQFFLLQLGWGYAVEYDVLACAVKTARISA